MAATSRASRFEFRGLVMRDPATNRAAVEATTPRAREDAGLQWAQEHALSFPDSLEVARDALQYATPAAWFTIRVLRSLGPRTQDVRGWLDRVADEREIDPRVRDMWEFSN